MKSEEIADHIERSVNQRMRLQFEAEETADAMWETFDIKKAIADPDGYIKRFFAQSGIEIMRKYGERAAQIGVDFAEGFDNA